MNNRGKTKKPAVKVAHATAPAAGVLNVDNPVFVDNLSEQRL